MHYLNDWLLTKSAVHDVQQLNWTVAGHPARSVNKVKLLGYCIRKPPRNSRGTAEELQRNSTGEALIWKSEMCALRIMLTHCKIVELINNSSPSLSGYSRILSQTLLSIYHPTSTDIASSRCFSFAS